MTTESWGIALVVLVALLVGAAIPVLIQLRATLRAVEKTVQRSGAKLDEALAATSSAATRVDALVARLEEGGRIEQLVDGVAATTRMVTQLRETVRVASALGAAVGPAVAAAVHAFREDREAAPAAPLHGDGGETGTGRPQEGEEAPP